jgi:hypothetical protein
MLYSSRTAEVAAQRSSTLPFNQPQQVLTPTALNPQCGHCVLCRRRLFDYPSLAELDAAFAAEVAALHREQYAALQSAPAAAHKYSNQSHNITVCCVAGV